MYLSKPLEFDNRKSRTYYMYFLKKALRRSEHPGGNEELENIMLSVLYMYEITSRRRRGQGEISPRYSGNECGL